MKMCKTCNIEKEEKDFAKLKSSKDGLSHECKKCKNNRLRQWFKKNPEKTKEYEDKRRDWKRNYHLTRRYGLTTEEYNKKLLEQNGVCAICGNVENRKINGKNTALSVDHNHITGKIRGLLCCRCNLLVSNKMRELNRKADEYLLFYDSVETK